mgnify:CR=1 FL=1
MRYNKNWDDLGHGIQDAVDRAIRSRNYQQLNQTVRRAVETAVDVGGEAIRKAQLDMGLTVDGIAGQDTQRRLFSSYAVPNNI